jgi:CheY-like chemotaxis protein
MITAPSRAEFSLKRLSFFPEPALCEAKVGSIKVDQSQIEQVILNLVVNARDAMPDGGSLIIETSNTELDEQSAGLRAGVVPGKYVLLSVSDTGIGMTTEVKARIFEPFFTTKELGRGTGLGLSTVYGIVKQSGGNIWVYSEPGMGTTFKVYLPLVDESPSEGILPQRTPAQRSGYETILLVEDDGEVRKIVATLLSEQGYRLLVASHAQDAISQMAAAHPTIDLLLTDVVMPGMNGHALAELVLKHSPSTAVLYMSGYTDQMLMRHEELTNAFDYIQKPFTAETLLAQVRRALDTARITG